MKSFYTLAVSTMLASGLMAQTRIDSSIFPRAGMVLRISQAVDTPLLVTPSGNQPQFWDFSMLRTASYSEDSIQSAATAPSAALFPTASIVQPLIGSAFGTAYVEVTHTAVTRIGGGAELFVVSLVEPYANPHTLQIAPLSYLTSFNDNYQLNFGLAIDSVPFLRQLVDTLLASAPLPGGVSPDSLRLKIGGQRRTRIDALGQCLLPDSVTYDVLRQKVTEYNSWAIEARVVFFGSAMWVDVSNFLGSSLPIPVAQNDTAIYYDFLANNHVEPLVRLKMDNAETGVESAQFKGRRNPEPTAVENRPLAALSWRFYPNPSQGQILIEGPEQTWSLSVTDLSGRKVWQSNEQQGASTLNLNHLPKGLYVLQILDASGLPLAQGQRLLIK